MVTFVIFLGFLKLKLIKITPLIFKMTMFFCGDKDQNTYENIARIANAVQCHNLLSDYKDCHEFRFSIVRIVISVTNPRIVFIAVVVSKI